MYALGVVQTIQPIEKNPYLFSNDGTRFSMNDDIRIKKDPHRILGRRRFTNMCDMLAKTFSNEKGKARSARWKSRNEEVRIKKEKATKVERRIKK
jgi:hypothetical protein